MKQLSRLQKNKIFSSFIQVFAVIVIPISVLLTYERINDSHSFPIDTVRVSGSLSNIKTDDIEKLINPVLKNNGYFTLNLSQLQNILNKLVWVKEVNVRKVWPSEVQISIVENQAIANWNENSLLNSDGEIFKPLYLTPDLPVIHGNDGREKKLLATYIHANNIIEKSGSSIRRIEENNRRSIKLYLDNHIVIYSGDTKELNSNLQSFVVAYNLFDTTLKHNISYIDLRYPNGFSVGWK